MPRLQRAQLDQREYGASIRAREFAREAAYRGACCRRRRVDEVSDALGLHEIELAVEERALREFAGPRGPRARRSAPARGAAPAGPPCPCNSSTVSPVSSAEPGRTTRCPGGGLAGSAAKDCRHWTPQHQRTADDPGGNDVSGGSGRANDADAAAPGAVAIAAIVSGVSLIAPPLSRPRTPVASAVSPQRPPSSSR